MDPRHSLTGAWSKGRNKEYPYYICQNRSCDMKGKSLARDMFRRFWDARLSQSKHRHEGLSVEIDNLTERLLGTDRAALISAYESQIKKLELNKISLSEKAGAGIEPPKSHCHSGR